MTTVSTSETVKDSQSQKNFQRETPSGSEAGPARATDEGPLPIYGFQWRRDGKVLLHYLLDSEVHTFAFSVSANAILSFIPFIVMLYTIIYAANTNRTRTQLQPWPPRGREVLHGKS